MNKTAEEIMREAEDLIRRTEESLALTPEILQSVGLKEDQALNAEQQAEAEALFRQDMEAVERDVAEEAARLRFADVSNKPAAPRRMRSMI